jgi:SAM-dependent methyltransferase
MSEFHFWDTVDNISLEQTVGYILTQHTPKQAVGDPWLEKIITQRPCRILDFGCGVGRNTFYLANLFPDCEIVGYDNPAMLRKRFDYYKFHSDSECPSNAIFISDWELVKTQSFDMTIALFVVQHIFEEDLIRCAADIKQISKLLYVYSRKVNDDSKKNTWKILEKVGLIPERFMYWGDPTPLPYEPDKLEDECHRAAIYNFGGEYTLRP